MSDYSDLYRETILDHARRPRNLGVIPDATRHGEGYNPLCGDRLEVFIALDDDHIRDISFTGEGCAICLASASLMTQRLKGASIRVARETFAAFQDLLTRDETGAAERPDMEGPLGKLSVLAGVKKYPMRVKCATLAWHTMKAALDGGDRTVSTE